ncbi:ATP synthase F0 subunit 8 (mitochondrion) [Panonychus citri]|uniref:ATP synthase F0 subunit 8 n=1 Tax=Panonychus citri TaxID=50023 RepID=D9J2S5_PANCT|nr:ATP synthase F0 subunit 8 [Panonychus citri]ADJ66663.1 ATP synthase F0 subunit 8 [Panonychus citri]
MYQVSPMNWMMFLFYLILSLMYLFSNLKSMKIVELSKYHIKI